MRQHYVGGTAMHGHGGMSRRLARVRLNSAAFATAFVLINLAAIPPHAEAEKLNKGVTESLQPCGSEAL
jgi:hypothetical protein